MQFRIQCGSHYNALHFKGVIIYRRSHNLPINNDSPSHYLPGNFDWGVIILGESLLTVTMVFPLMKLLWADMQLLNLDRKLSVLPVYCFEHEKDTQHYWNNSLSFQV